MRQFTENLIDAAKRAKTTVEIVANCYGITPEQLKSRSRKRIYVWPRQVAMYIFYNNQRRGGVSFSVTGQLIGGYDHSTALYANNTVKDLLDVNRNVKAKVMEVKSKVEEVTGLGELDTEVYLQFKAEKLAGLTERIIGESNEALAQIKSHVIDDNLMEGWRKAEVTNSVKALERALKAWQNIPQTLQHIAQAISEKIK